MPELREACVSLVYKAELSVDSLPHWLAVSATHDISAALDRYFAFAASCSNINAILGCASCHESGNRAESPCRLRIEAVQCLPWNVI